MRTDKIKDTLDNIKLRLKLLFSRASVTYVYQIEPGKLRHLQVHGLGLDDKIEHAEAYGLAVYPLEGAEAFVSSILGQRSHLVATIISDPRHRPTGGRPGEVVLWSRWGQTVWFHADGTAAISAPKAVTVDAPEVTVNAPTVTINGTDVNVNATNVAISAQSASLDCDDIAFGGEDAQPVARIGDLVNVTSGSSAGLHEIVSGSSKMRVG
ncbi:phage baseplate assembly protein domain-containing protein [Thalassospira alkalitolerans]|uniref:phage baseplate assembly protein domain-containing protein n=1 Tax=Thalassospira alkalitolerans TaxID=1293890 RepID=UPI000A1E6386|nr:phage baseplate assembly protein [Thalassospira alkalitolerans]